MAVWLIVRSEVVLSSLVTRAILIPPSSSRYAAAHRSRCGRGEVPIAEMVV